MKGKITITDKDGTVVNTCNVNLVKEDTGQDSPAALPRTMEWYRDLTKWLVALSFGAVVLGLGFIKETPFNTLQKAAFSLSGILLAASASTGIFCNLWISNLGNSLENIDRLKNSGGEEKEIQKFEQKTVKAGKFINYSYKSLILTFFLGIASFIAFSMTWLWSSAGDVHSGKADKAITELTTAEFNTILNGKVKPVNGRLDSIIAREDALINKAVDVIQANDRLLARLQKINDDIEKHPGQVSSADKQQLETLRRDIDKLSREVKNHNAAFWQLGH